MSVTINYAEVKAQLVAAGYPTSSGSAWQGIDAQSYNLWATGLAYGTGTPVTDTVKNAFFYGFPYNSLMPTCVVDALENAEYTATISFTPSVGNSPLSVTFTVTEPVVAASSYEWTLGNGNVVTTTVPSLTYSFTSSGTLSYPATTMTPTVNGQVLSPISAAAGPTVIVYSATLGESVGSGAHPLAVTLTLTETGKPSGGTYSYAWTFGDGTTANTSTPSTTHTYTAAGNFTPSVIPTIDGIVQSTVTGTAIVVS